MVTQTAQTQKLDVTTNGEVSVDCGILKFLFYTMFISHCSWKPQMDGLKNAETSSMDFCTQLITLKGWKKQFENLWADF